MIDCLELCDDCTWLDAEGREVQLYCGNNALTCLRPEWDRLLPYSTSDQFFSLSSWQQLWWKHFGHDYSLHVLTVRDVSGSLAANAPLMMSRGGRPRTLSFVGGTEVADYLDFIVDRDDAESLTRTLLSSMRDRLDWDRLALHCLPQESLTRRVVQEVYGDAGIEVETEREDVSPFVELRGSWDAYLASLSKKDRHELRRKLRRAVVDQQAIWLHVETADDLERCMDAFVTLHRLSSANKAAFMTSQMEAYFRDLCKMALHCGTLRMGVLWVGDVPVSTALGFAYKGRLYLYNSGYDPAYAAHSVGIAAVGLVLKDSATEGLEVFDFLQGDEPYKYTLGASDRLVYKVVCSRGPRR